MTILPPPEIAEWMRKRPPHPFEEGCVCNSCGRAAGWIALGMLVTTAFLFALAWLVSP